MAALLVTRQALDTERGDLIRLLDVSVWSNRAEGRMQSGKHAGARVWVTWKLLGQP